MEHKMTVKDIFWKFLKIGSLSFGGVYSMLAFFERELVEKEKWLAHYCVYNGRSFFCYRRGGDSGGNIIMKVFGLFTNCSYLYDIVAT